MSLDTIQKAIFITNTFAGAYPAEHQKLWERFEQEVPAAKRTGAYGVDNMAYIKWLRNQQEPLVVSFLSEYIVGLSG